MAHEQPTSTVLARTQTAGRFRFQNQQILFFEPATQDRFTLTLQESVEMKGIIHKHDGTALSARLIATPTSGIAGRNLVVTTTTDSQGRFQLQLIDGLDYRWSIFPEDTSYAPLFLDAITAEAQEDWGAPILLPEPESLRFITGTLKANIQPNATATPIAGLQVRLLVAIEWSHQPAKAMRMAPLKFASRKGFERRIEIVPIEDNTLWPTLRINDFVLEDTLDLGPVDLGSWPTENASNRVTDLSGEPVSSAKIYAAGDMGKGQIQFFEATDEAGELVTSWPDNA